MSRLTRLAAAVLLAALPSAAAMAAETKAPHNSPEQAKTIGDLRNVGTAMWQWYKAVQAPHRSESAHKAAEAAAQGPQDVADVPVISRADLAKLLVPTYIAAIPEKDGWGHPYEYHLNTTDPNAPRVMALRSAGRDGKFSGNVYEIAAFAASDTDQDIAWFDGYFVRWPEAPQKGK
jgi:hypothetical protein